MRSAVAAGLIVGLCLALAPSADARLARTTAYLVALNDAKEVAFDLGSPTGYSTPACKRINLRRVDCRVSAGGSEFEVDPEGSYYLHRWCRWVVATRQWRLYPYHRSFRRGLRCKRWASDSP